MEKIKTLIVLSLMLYSEIALSQHSHSTPFVRKSLMSMSTGLSAGAMVFNPVQEVYFTGSFAYCVEQQIGVRTDLYIFLPDYNFEGQLQKNSCILFGPEFHLPLGHFDWSILFEPGIAFPYFKDGTANKKAQAEPVFQFSLATTYYFLRNFHVSVSASYLHGNYFLESTNPYKLDELRLNASLGINIFVNHQQAFNRKDVKF
ncbi:MAG: hypothetical protein ABIQ74_13890 [Chitinophagales bacterium]